jgi:hypothetical protein
VLYGSAASGEFSAKRSNINILVVLDDAGVDNLSRARSLLNSRKHGRINPVFVSEEFLKSSADVFPIEFLDMKENYTLLRGADSLKDLAIDGKNLRFQCEHELKAAIINLKRLCLKGPSAGLEGALLGAATSAMHILRSFLKSKGAAPRYGKEAALDEIERALNLEMAALRRLLEAKRLAVRLGRKETDLLSRAFVRELEAAAAVIDRS